MFLEEENTVEMSVSAALSTIDEISKLTRELFESFSDEDIDRVYEKELPTRTIKHSLRWILHHLIDHEAQHKGQIFMLKRMLGE